MTDDKPPPQPTTKQIPKVEVPGNTIDAILSEVRAMRAESGERFDRLETTVDTLVEDGKAANQRITRIEIRLDNQESRAESNSVRAKSITETDHQQDAAIAQIVMDVASLKETQGTQLAILQRLDAVAANPMVRRVAYAIGAAVLAYLSTKGWITR